jgi:hypothetical protein
MLCSADQLKNSAKQMGFTGKYSLISLSMISVTVAKLVSRSARLTFRTSLSAFSRNFRPAAAGLSVAREQ